MTDESSPAKPATRGVAGRIAVAAVIGAILFAALWYTVFSAATAALIAAGVLVVGASVSDVFETLLEMLANAVLGILAAIGAFFAAIFSLFN